MNYVVLFFHKCMSVYCLLCVMPILLRLFSWNIFLAMMSKSLNLGVCDVSSCFKIICCIE